MIRKMKVDDAEQVVGIHLSSFPGFFLSFLGECFLRLYYRRICLSEEGISFVYCSSSGDVAGFVVGSTHSSGFYKRLLKKDWFRFVLASLGAVLKRPRIITRLIRAVSYPGQLPKGVGVAGLYSIAVSPELHGHGAGKALVSRFLDEAANRGCFRVFLTTDADGNDAVNQFYVGLGFVIEQQYVTPEGRLMNQYWIDIPKRNG